MPRPRRPPLPAGLAPALLVALVVVGAAAAGPWQSTLRIPNGPRWEVRLRPPPPPAPPPRAQRNPLAAAHDNWVLFALLVLALVVAVAVVVALAVAVLLVVTRWVREHWRLPERRRAEDTPEFNGIPLAAARVAEAVERAERAAAAATNPTDGVVRAWVALEDAAALSGVARAPASTPTEFVVDVLDRTGADPAATRGLLGVYEHARFGSDAITDEEVAFARECLAGLRRGIQVSVP